MAKRKDKTYRKPLKSININFTDENDVVTSKNKLIELDGKKSAVWKSWVRENTDASSGMVTNFNKFHATLIAACLWSEDRNCYWTIDEVDALPATVQMDLFQECNYLNGYALEPLELDEDDNPKGESPATTSTGSVSPENLVGPLPNLETPKVQ